MVLHRKKKNKAECLCGAKMYAVKYCAWKCETQMTLNDWKFKYFKLLEQEWRGG